MRIAFFTALNMFFILLSPGTSWGQDYEIGLFVGGSNYQGDLADEVIQLVETHMAYGAILRLNVAPKISINTHVYFGTISGNDANSGLPSRRARGFSFSAPLTELGLNVEWTPFKSPYRRYGPYHPTIQPFLFSGLGLTLCAAHPTAPVTDVPYPFPEAGSRTYFINMPAGIGLKFKLAEQYSVNLELGYRYVFSDYLDGVSVAGNPRNKDWYIFGGISFNYCFSDSQR